MKRNLKSFFRKAVHIGTVSESPSPQPETRPGPAQLLEQRHIKERKSEVDQSQDRRSYTQSSEPSSHHDSSKHTSRRSSVQHPKSLIEDHAVGATDYAPHPQDVPMEEEDSIANDYQAYLPAVSPSSKTSADAEFFSLGGDSRLRTGNSEMRHNEDIANRNIDQYGSNSSWHSSLTSQQPGNQAALDHNVRRKSVAASIESLGSPSSAAGSASSIQPKYTLGTGVATEGSLIDGILPHVKDTHALPYNRKDWPSRIARDESFLNAAKRNRRGSNDAVQSNIRRESFGRRDEKAAKHRSNDAMDLREAAMGGPEDYINSLRTNLDGFVDLRNTEDVDKETRSAPAVVHEVVKPHEHEIIEERIYRKIHNHGVYHYIQPVYETEILPARHWVYSANNELVEVPADKLSECTGANQSWSIVRGDREKPNAHVVQSPAQVREPRIISDKTYITPEGFERRETTILHPPELEDMSNYDGPVLPIEFHHHPDHAPEHESKKSEKGLDHPPKSQRFKMDELSESLPITPTLSNGSASSTSQPPTGSSTSTPQSKRLSVARRSIPAL